MHNIGDFFDSPTNKKKLNYAQKLNLQRPLCLKLLNWWWLKDQLWPLRNNSSRKLLDAGWTFICSEPSINYWFTAHYKTAVTSSSYVWILIPHFSTDHGTMTEPLYCYILIFYNTWDYILPVLVSGSSVSCEKCGDIFIIWQYLWQCTKVNYSETSCIIWSCWTDDENLSWLSNHPLPLKNGSTRENLDARWIFIDPEPPINYCHFEAIMSSSSAWTQIPPSSSDHGTMTFVCMHFTIVYLYMTRMYCFCPLCIVPFLTMTNFV